MYRHQYTTLSLIGLLCLSLASAQQLHTIHEWNLIKYETPAGYPKNGTFRADRSLILSAEVGLDRLFFAIPKSVTDNPATLVYVPKHSEERSPTFEAYPNWDWHKGSVEGQPITEDTCNGFINVYKLQVDRCERLWVLDTGIIFPLNSDTRQVVCPPKLVVFNLQTHEEIKRIELRKDVVRVNSLLSTFVIDDTDESGAEPAGVCDVGHIYIADVETPAIIVIHMQTNDMWRHSDSTFFPHPEHGKLMHSTGESEIVMFGINGMDLSSPGLGAHRDLFYNTLASKTIYAVSTSALKNQPNPSYLLELPIRKVVDKPAQSWPICYDPLDNSLIFSPLNDTALLSWSLGDHKYRVLSYDPVALQGVSSIHSAIMDESTIWVISTRIAKATYDTVNPNEINQRVLRLHKATAFPPRYTTLTSSSSVQQNH